MVVPFLRINVLTKHIIDAFVECLINSTKDFGEYVSEVVNEKLQFINLDDSNITRCSGAQWWIEFIVVVKRLKLSLPELPKSSIDRLYNYFDNISASLYALSEALGEQVWYSFHERGKLKAKPRHRQIISDYRCLSMA